jgi:hypothetical protein
MVSTSSAGSIEKLYRLTVELGNTLDEQREVSTFFTWLATEVNPQFAALYVADEIKCTLKPVGALGYGTGLLPLIPLGEDVWRHLEGAIPAIRTSTGRRYGIPLVLEGEVLGFLAVVSSASGSALQAEKKLLAAATGCLAPTLRNIWRYQSLEDQVRRRTAQLLESEARHRKLAQRLNLLREVDRAILEAKPAVEVAQVAVRRIPDLVPGTAAALLMTCKGSPEAEVVAASQLQHGPWLPLGMRLSLDGLELSPSCQPQLFLLHEGGEDRVLLPQALREFLPNQLAWVLLSPVGAEETLWGVLLLAGLKASEWQEEYRELARDFCESLGLAFRQQELREELRSHQEELERRVRKRTEELQKLVNLMAGREIRMAELKEVIKLLRKQLLEAGLTPVADDPLALGEESPL